MISLGKSRIYKMFRNCSMQNKIVAIFLAIIALLALAGSAVVFVYLNTLYKEQTLASANMELGKVNDMIAKEIENVYHASYVVQYNENIAEVLRDRSTKTIEEQYQNMWTMDEALDTATMPFLSNPFLFMWRIMWFMPATIWSIARKVN